ncbi:ribonuclease E inhibitor RraB [Paraneptunicella aestuarii]|uniref:ribonuclease E inhibitor RraB n=1 Tax=Paraneptunicella aestuarii TaxID=2831148 RepID=UPI001E607488|nr:ribonuclease E inhibitor RraB [Paraneptunicella aestuarii]UAA38311.1 ribonuclease E inhibitor RraB [Paraneptunicella aestuarii]
MSTFDATPDWYEFNSETVDALLADGSNPTLPHTIEYHLAGKDFDKLEKAAVDLFKAGFEVSDAEELQLDDGSNIFSFDAIKEMKLDLDTLNKDTKFLLEIAEKHGVFYDGWGTYFVE